MSLFLHSDGLFSYFYYVTKLINAIQWRQPVIQDQIKIYGMVWGGSVLKYLNHC